MWSWVFSVIRDWILRNAQWLADTLKPFFRWVKTWVLQRLVHVNRWVSATFVPMWLLTRRIIELKRLMAEADKLVKEDTLRDAKIAIDEHAKEEERKRMQDIQRLKELTLQATRKELDRRWGLLEGIIIRVVKPLIPAVMPMIVSFTEQIFVGIEKELEGK